MPFRPPLRTRGVPRAHDRNAARQCRSDLVVEIVAAAFGGWRRLEVVALDSDLAGLTSYQAIVAVSALADDAPLKRRNSDRGRAQSNSRHHLSLPCV